MKIAILFRGPVRPQPSSVIDRYREFMSQFQGAQGVEIHTYLATWRNWKHYKASELLSMDLFDNVIMQTAPTEEHRLRCTGLTHLHNGASIEPVFNMYYQSKTALDIIVRADTYSYIVHTRTDLRMIMGRFINEWFDPNHYVAPHIHTVPNSWMCDQFGVATGEQMHKAWDYGDIQNLGEMIEKADIPERILEMMIEKAGIKVKAGNHDAWQLDPNRNA